MSSLMESLGLDKESIDKVEEQEVYEGGAIPSGIYNAMIDRAYIWKTDGGANMLQVDFILNDSIPFKWSTAIKSGDEKGNKATWTVREDHSEYTKKKYGVGTEVPLPGVVDMQLLLKAAGLNDADVKDGVVVHKDKQIKAGVIPDLQGKKLKLGIAQEENFFNNEITIKNYIKYFMDMEGKNNKGNIIEEKAQKDLEKRPLKKLKNVPASQPTTGSNDTAGLAGSGWG